MAGSSPTRFLSLPPALLMRIGTTALKGKAINARLFNLVVDPRCHACDSSSNYRV